MGIISSTLLVLVFLFLAVKQIIKNGYGHEPVEERTKWCPVVLFSSVMALIVNLCLGGDACQRMPFCVATALFALYLQATYVVPDSWSGKLTVAAVSADVVYMSVVLIDECVFCSSISSAAYRYMAVAVCVSTAVVFLFAIYLRLSNVKMVMRTGSVWTMVCMCMDSVYMVLLLLTTLLTPVLHPLITSLLMGVGAVALCTRIRNMSVFVIFTDHELRIVESMRIAQVDVVGESPGENRLYGFIYERVLNYFEKNKPYLNNNLTINDITEVVFTNKLYISRAISQHTGRNFCQFVNYYRVSYAVELFRSNPKMKVVEMSTRSGFNTTTSFGAAFRLYMAEKPSDWCRKERKRLEKLSK